MHDVSNGTAQEKWLLTNSQSLRGASFSSAFFACGAAAAAAAVGDGRHLYLCIRRAALAHTTGEKTTCSSHSWVNEGEEENMI